jgi:CheY-like chemotaxis protein
VTVQLRNPRVLVVDDDPRNLNVRREQLEEWNFDVVLADSEASALTQIEASPEMDAVLTDINFEEENLDDITGVELARTIQTRFADIPLFAYSVKVDEGRLLDEAEGLFVRSFPKGIKTMEEVRDIAESIRDAALQRRRRRRTESEQRRAELMVSYPLEKIGAAETVRRLLPHARNAADIEASLKAAGYHLELVHSSVFLPSANPVLVWVKQLDGEAEAEVYGQSTLYAHGESGDEAMAKLVELMRLFAEDFGAGEGDADGPALRLQEFLERTMLPAGSE